MSKILMIGGGRISGAVRSILRDGLIISVYDKNPAKCSIATNKEEVFKSAEVIFVCVPSGGLPKAASDIKELSNKEAKVVFLTKGMMEGDKFMYEYLSDLSRDYYLLYGPMLAKEIVDQNFTGATLAGDGASHKEVVDIFDSNKIFIETTTDVKGASVLGVLKNVYTILLSTIECFEFGDNYYGAVLSRVYREAEIVVEHFGGTRNTVAGFAGLGDLVATSRSPHSSNKTFAVHMVQRGVCDVPAEGWKALPALLRRLHLLQPKLAALSVVDKVVGNKDDLKKMVRDLITSSPTH